MHEPQLCQVFLHHAQSQRKSSQSKAVLGSQPDKVAVVFRGGAGQGRQAGARRGVSPGQGRAGPADTTAAVY